MDDDFSAAMVRRDASGQMCICNPRPATKQPAQTDPIVVAGGLNV